METQPPHVACGDTQGGLSSCCVLFSTWHVMLVGPVGPVLLAVPVRPAFASNGPSFNMQLMLVSLLYATSFTVEEP